MTHKFLNKVKKISISQVDIREYFKFYTGYICPYLYKYTLEDDTEIEINFNEKHFSHLLGLHKFREIMAYNSATEINKNILNGKIIFKNLYTANKNFINQNIELRDRMTYFPTLKTLLENTTSVLRYDLNVIWNSKIEFSFLLHSNKITILVYLAVKEIRDNTRVCVPVSFLVDRNDRFSKMNLENLKIKSLSIIKK